MEYVLICSGIWTMIFAFVKWSLESKNRLLKGMCVINGTCLVVAGIVSVFSSFNDRSIFLSFLLSLLLIGMLISFKLKTEKNTISVFAVLSSVVLIACAIGMALLADSIDDIIYACAVLTGCVMILSTPFGKLYEKMKDNGNK